MTGPVDREILRPDRPGGRARGHVPPTWHGPSSPPQGVARHRSRRGRSGRRRVRVRQDCDGPQPARAAPEPPGAAGRRGRPGSRHRHGPGLRKNKRDRVANTSERSSRTPMSSLNPSMRIGRQISETAPGSGRCGVARAAGRARPCYRARTGIPARALRWPATKGHDRDCRGAQTGSRDRGRADHRFGRHRAGSDSRARIRELRSDIGCSFTFITHDLAVAAEIADRVVVMYAGRIVESGPTSELALAPGPLPVALLGLA